MQLDQQQVSPGPQQRPAVAGQHGHQPPVGVQGEHLLPPASQHWTQQRDMKIRFLWHDIMNYDNILRHDLCYVMFDLADLYKIWPAYELTHNDSKLVVFIIIDK